MSRKGRCFTVGLSIVTVAGICGLPICDARRAFNVAVRVPLIGWFVAHNLRPSDYFIPLATAPFSDGEHSLEFECRYRGRHEIQVWPLVDGTPFENSVGMEIVVEAEGGTTLFRHKQEYAEIRGGALLNGTNVYNYCYAILEVPHDLPIGVNLIARIRCWGKVSDIKRLNPNAKIVVRKMPDK